MGAAIAALAVVGALLTPGAASAVVASGPDGRTQETAAASCWEIKQNNPAAADGVYWLVTPGLVYPQQFYCDQTTDGGGWVLVGRGREAWKESYNGLGTPEQVANTPTGTAAFAPAELPAKTVDGLLNNGRPDALPDGIRVRRATNAAGSAWQEVRFSLAKSDRWEWTFGAKHSVAAWSFVDAAGGVSSSGTGGLSTNVTSRGGLDNIVFSQRATHGYRMGWAYGWTVQGTTDDSSYLWGPPDQGYATPFAQVFLRPQLRLAELDFATAPDTTSAPQTLPEIPNSAAVKSSWGVSGLANGRTGEANIEVSDFGEAAGAVFVGGNFLHVQQSRDGAGQVEQPYLAAFDVKTGGWVSSFRPKLDGQVKSIQALPDGRIAIGGQFTTVNGTAQPALAFLDPHTGQLSGWQVKAEHRTTGGLPFVRDLDLRGDDLYVAGSFTHLTAVGSTTSASAWNGGRIILSTGKPDTNWNANLNGTAASVDANDAGDRAYYSGYFLMKDTSSTPSAAALQTVAGAPLVPTPWVPTFSDNRKDDDGNYINQVWQLGVVEVDGRVWLGGSQHSMFSYDRNSFELLSGSVPLVGGDLQTVETNGSVVIGGCHCGDYVYDDAFSNTLVGGFDEADKINLVGAWDPKTGKYIPDWSPTLEAREGYGAWGTFFDSTGTLWVGGDFNRSQLPGGAEQWSGGFIRFAPRDAVAPTTPGAVSSTPSADGKTATLTWGASTDAGSGVTYEVLQGNRVIASTTSASYTVPVTSTAANYFVRARDAVGNRSASTAAFTVAPAPANALTFVGNGDSWSWRYSSDALPATWNATTFDASSWPVGKALFGRGVSGAATNIDPSNLATKPLSAQFRKTFTVTSAASVTNAKVSLIANDGAVVYLNGRELGRVRMPAGAVTQNTYATAAVAQSSAAGTRAVFTVPAGALTEGTNVLAVSVHANYRTTADLGFDLAFTGERAAPPAAVTGLVATPAQTSVVLGWSAPAGSTAAASYVVSRNGVKVGTVTAPATTFTDTGLTASTAYTYTVTAVSAAGVASTPATVQATTTAAVPVGPAVSVPNGSAWSWRYSGDALPGDWNAVGFDASSWAVGKGVLGRGATVATNIDPSNLATKPLSAQFRTSFTVSDAASVKDGTVSVIADDGVVLYLNGVELGRANLPAGSITQNTYATAAPRATKAAGARVTFQVPATLVKEGTNVLAASVHANYRGTPDLTFDAALTMPR
ncbi:fibrinogen-like YCDxxxxGGGW domain-containing protein [Microbacterium sp. K41]|uniref:fibrinogen-like YCDxxxxGGGW domain-containing protein n=1 Tax=Microbacterium sp. K41 TaxID=2305437 RepID=UPI00109BF83A|nr:fibrinogen-like YCDxxxxGGGW domain-containing protein [Microbacterium sp. K41]